MKLKTLSILIFGVLPAVALAAGDHAGGHGMDGHKMMPGGHDMSAMEKAAPASMTGKPGDPAKVSRTIEVTIDLRGMAGAVARWYAEADFVLRHVVCVVTSDSKSIRLEVVDPLIAAPACWALVDIDHRGCRGGPGRLGKTKDEKAGNKIFHTGPLFRIRVSMEWGSHINLTDGLHLCHLRSR